MSFNPDVSIRQSISIAPPLQSENAPVTEHSELQQETNKVAQPAIENGGKPQADEAKKPLGLPARVMGLLTKNVVTKTLFGRSNKTQAAKAPSEPVKQGPAVPARRGSQAVPLAQKQEAKERGLVVGLQLKQVATVLAECKANPKKAPCINKDGSITAQVPKSSNKTQVDVGLAKVLQVLDDARKLNIAPMTVNSEPVGYKELHQQLVALPAVANASTSVAARINSSQVSFVNSAAYPAALVPMSKDAIVTALKTNSDPALTLLMLNSHRNNPETKGILKDLGGAQGDGEIKNALSFAQQYIDGGASIPVGDDDKKQLSEQLQTIANLGKNSQSDDLKQLGAKLEASIHSSSSLQPQKKLDFSHELPKPGSASPKQLKESRELLTNAKLVLSERSALQAKITSLEKEGGNEDRIAGLKGKISDIDNKYPKLETEISDLQQKLLDHEPSMPKFSLQTATAEEFADQLCKAINSSYCKIQPSELDGRGWDADLTRNSHSPNIQKHIELSNNLTGFISQEAVTANSPEVMTKLMTAMDMCVKNGNAQAASLINQSLAQTSVDRLLPTLAKVDSKIIENKNNIAATTLSMTSSYKGTRELVAKSLMEGKSTNIDLSVQMGDLTFIDEGNPAFVGENNDVNVVRMKQIDDVKTMMTACQQSIQKGGVPEADDSFLNTVSMMNLKYKDATAEMYNKSLEILPRGLANLFKENPAAYKRVTEDPVALKLFTEDPVAFKKKFG